MTWVESTAQLQGHAWQGDPETQLRSSLSSCVSHPSGLPPLQQMLVAGDLIGIAIVDLNPSVACRRGFAHGHDSTRDPLPI